MLTNDQCENIARLKNCPDITIGQETIGHVRLSPESHISLLFSFCLNEHRHRTEGNPIPYLKVNRYIVALNSSFKVSKCAETGAGTCAFIVTSEVTNYCKQFNEAGGMSENVKIKTAK